MMNRIDRFLERLERFQDHLFAVKSITVTEALLLWLSIGVGLWLALFDVSATSTVYRYLGSEAIWSAALLTITAIHLTGVFSGRMALRRISAYGYAFLWTIWTATGTLSNYQSLVLPVFVPITFTAMIHAARLNARL